MKLYILHDNATGVLIARGTDQNALISQAQAGQSVVQVPAGFSNVPDSDLSKYKYADGWLHDNVDPLSPESFEGALIKRQSLIKNLKKEIVGMISVTKYSTAVGDLIDGNAKHDGGLFYAEIKNAIWLFVDLGHRSKTDEGVKITESGLCDMVDDAERATHDWIDNTLEAFGMNGISIADHIKGRVNG